MSDGRVASIDELLDRAVAAINRGDWVAASALADQVLVACGISRDRTATIMMTVRTALNPELSGRVGV